jgi:hypothetical protein
MTFNSGKEASQTRVDNEARGNICQALPPVAVSVAEAKRQRTVPWLVILEQH